VNRREIVYLPDVGDVDSQCTLRYARKNSVTCVSVTIAKLDGFAGPDANDARVLRFILAKCNRRADCESFGRIKDY
jgi:hypothetical protein